ncbi:Cupin-like domain containing protein [Novymonas esmeraldas]|uniref:Cupin-like domain containing protein n=1 Tax=Novymonas esmeraldas TaxID=1808958 RepID=A0AAW0EJZ1_9TRYP
MSASTPASTGGAGATPPTLLEAFATSAAALRHFGIPRIRVVGLSDGCTQDDHARQRIKPDGKDFDTLLQESARRCPHQALGTASHRICSGQDAARAVTANQEAPIVTEQEFMHKFVFHSRPCVILDALEGWPALQRWRDDRHVFDLDHALPPEAETESMGDEGGDTDEEEEEEEGDTAASRTASVTLGRKKVTVALTPNGRADAVARVTYATDAVPVEEAATVYAGAEAQRHAVLLPRVGHTSANGAAAEAVRREKLFMCAAELRVTLPQLYGLLQRTPVRAPANPTEVDMREYADQQRAPAIAYAQLQNNCLNTEYRHLHADLSTNVERFGCRVFDQAAVEAANVWFGVPASVSSLHQDWVENLYSVVRGVKEFVLLPPWEGPFIPKPDIPAAAFAIDEAASHMDPDDDRAETWTLQFKQYPVKDGTVVPWMDFDLAGADVEGDAAAAARAVLESRLLEKHLVRQSVSALSPPGVGTRKPLDDGDDTAAAAAAAAREEAAMKPLHPLVAYVHPGETLYLPAMWLHRVAQHADSTDLHARAEHHAAAAAGGAATPSSPPPPLPLVAAVNYWYDMSFNNPSVVLLREFGLLL